MKKQIIVFAMLLLTISMFAVWVVGEPITDNYSWIDVIRIYCLSWTI